VILESHFAHAKVADSIDIPLPDTTSNSETFVPSQLHSLI